MSDSLPTITVVIPCYNGREFVADAVRSVLAGADAGVRCVVVDDGSTDGSAEVVERLGLGATVVRQANAGVGAARNRGAQEADTDLISWLDADDFLTPGTIAIRRREFAADPQLEYLLGRNLVRNVDTGEEVVNPPDCGPDFFERVLLFRRHLPHTNAMTFRRAALAKLGPFDPSLRSADDFDLWLRAFTALRMKYIPDVLSVQRTGTFPSLTRRNGRIKNYWDVNRTLLKNRDRSRQHLGSDAPWRRAYADFATDYALAFLNVDDRRSAGQWAARAILHGRGRVESRVYRYLLEGVLPPAVWNWMRSGAAWVRPS